MEENEADIVKKIDSALEGSQLFWGANALVLGKILEEFIR